MGKGSTEHRITKLETKGESYDKQLVEINIKLDKILAGGSSKAGRWLVGAIIAFATLQLAGIGVVAAMLYRG